MRLTVKRKIQGKSDYFPSGSNSVDTCINKLGKIEDIMEDNGIENVKELKEMLDDGYESAMFTIQVLAFIQKKKLLKDFNQFLRDFKEGDYEYGEHID